MSHLVSRILLAIFLFPLAAIFYLLVFIAVSSFWRYSSGSYRTTELVGFVIAGGGTWLAVALYWWLLWRATVRWTAARVSRTLVAVLGAMGGGIVVGVIASLLLPDSGSGTFGAFIGGIVAIMLWLIATVFIWRHSPNECVGHAGVSCPVCGYNLTGLSESRCPECGSRFTLDQLLANQPVVPTAAELE